VILFWGCNPIVTSIPNAHFFTEAKYNGSQIVCICAGLLAIRHQGRPVGAAEPGHGCGALALAVAREIVEAGHVDEAFVTEQTDLPLLVRMDTGKLLSEAEAKGGRTDRFTMMDRNARANDGAGQVAFKLGGLEPVLDVERGTITLPDRSIGAVCARSTRCCEDRLEALHLRGGVGDDRHAGQGRSRSSPGCASAPRRCRTCPAAP
jgi:nitrate reductase alpha subunit